jgi:glucose/mannose transport system permease protein
VKGKSAAYNPDTIQLNKASRYRRMLQRILPPLILSPSLIAIGVFVYGFIGIAIYVSLSKWGTMKMNLAMQEPLFRNYADLLAMPRFQSDIRNILAFTVMFLIVVIITGLLLALLLDKAIPGKSVFRAIFLLPYSFAFIVTGVLWRWIFNPVAGINHLLNVSGFNWLMEKLGAGRLQPGWLTDTKVVMSINGVLGNLFPKLNSLSIEWGVPLALIPIVIAATWQLSGFVMSVYLAGLSAVPDEVREAASIDGAGTFRIYWSIILPLLKPATVTVMVLMGNMSLRTFDLIYAMNGSGPGFVTDVPGIFVLDLAFKASRNNIGAAAAVIMLLMVSIVIIPYLVRSIRKV